MVKADPTRNYYADLKISANATENEIRKAFRTLALQYHPDRNPGHEAEFVVKFQEIQAAHEILCDQTQRAKYDAERRKYRSTHVPASTPNTPRARPPPPSRNAYTTSTPSGSYYRASSFKPSPQQQRPPPPPHHNTFSNGADRFTNKNFRPPPTAQRPDTKPKEEYKVNAFTAWQKMKQPRGEERQQHNPAAQSSTQNNPNGNPFGRSQSTRVPSSKQGFNPATPGADEGQARSAYRNYARPAPTPPKVTTPPKASSNSMEDSQSNEVPYSEANRVRTPYYSTAAGERTSMFEGIGRSSSVRNSPTHSHRPSPSQDAGAYSDSGRRQQRNSYGGNSKNPDYSKNPFRPMYPDSSDEDEEESEVLRAFRAAGDVHRAKAQAPPPAWAQREPQTPQQNRQTNGAATHVPNSFKSRSEESINMKFSPSDWHGKFEGNADYFFAPHTQKGFNNRGRTSPARGRPHQAPNFDRNPFINQPPMGPPPVSTFSQPVSSFPIPPPPPGPPPGPPPPTAGAPATRFSPKAWQDTFKDPNWVYTETKETSPRRASEATKRSKPARKPSIPQNGGSSSKTQDQPEASRPRYQAFAEEMSNGDDDAMDIDSATPPNPIPGKREVHMGPTSPRMNTGAYSGTVSNGAATAPSPATAAKHSPTGLNGIGILANVEPFVQTRTRGLTGLGELGDALPFDSQPSQSHPTKPSTSQRLKYPDVPHPPLPPVKLDQASVDHYLKEMERYAKGYKKYCKTLTGHFIARDVELDNLDDCFIHHRGETTKKLGFTSYLAKMKEDEEVVETWKVAHEKHIQVLQQCEEIRNKTIKMYQTLHT